MNNKHQVHNLIILDESGSMGSIKKTIINGFNELVQTIKSVETEFPEQEHFISFISFNGDATKLLHFVDPVRRLNEINSHSYQPNASTPLFDAMGFGINKLIQFLEGKTGYNVLVTILTDGEENSSIEYKLNDIKELIKKLKKENWTFTYIGTEHNVEDFAESLEINNTMRFDKNEESMKQMFFKEKSARTFYSEKIRNKENTESNFYE